jgi:hypothetical protein
MKDLTFKYMVNITVKGNPGDRQGLLKAQERADAILHGADCHPEIEEWDLIRVGAEDADGEELDINND